MPTRATPSAVRVRRRSLEAAAKERLYQASVAFGFAVWQAVQVFMPLVDNTPLIGAVGQLQFEVVEHRLKSEYGVDAVFESCDVYTARWVTCDDPKVMAEFEKKNAHNIAWDAAGNLAYFASSKFNLELTQEKWPQITFHATREHAVKLEQG